jgi:hypothetical protein
MDAFIGENLRVMIIAFGDLWAGAVAVVYELCTGLSSIGMRDRQRIELKFSSGAMVQSYHSLYTTLL